MLKGSLQKTIKGHYTKEFHGQILLESFFSKYTSFMIQDKIKRWRLNFPLKISSGLEHRLYTTIILFLWKHKNSFSYAFHVTTPYHMHPVLGSEYQYYPGEPFFRNWLANLPNRVVGPLISIVILVKKKTLATWTLELIKCIR